LTFAEEKTYTLFFCDIDAGGPRVQGHNLSLKENGTVAGPPPEERSSGSGFFMFGLSMLQFIDAVVGVPKRRNN